MNFKQNGKHGSRFLLLAGDVIITNSFPIRLYLYRSIDCIPQAWLSLPLRFGVEKHLEYITLTPPNPTPHPPFPPPPKKKHPNEKHFQ